MSKQRNQNTTILKSLLKAFIIIIIAFILGLIVPGIIAYNSGVFYQTQMINKLPSDAYLKYKKFTDQQKEVKLKIILLDSLVNCKVIRGQNISDLVSAQNFYQKELNTINHPINILPFYLNPIMLVWVIMYTCLGWLIVLFKPSNKILDGVTLTNTLIIAFIIYVLYQWTVWMRNFVLSNEKRVVYSFANYDVSPALFITQEINTILFSILLSIIWQQWTKAYAIKHQMLQTLSDEKPIKLLLNHIQANKLSKTFIQWQVVSIILAIGFIDFTSAFWNLVVKNHDQRYIVAAITIHTLWGVSWLLISLPLIKTFYQWHTIKFKAYGDILNSKASEENLTYKMVSDLQPLGFWNLATSGTISIISFLLPIIQAFIK